MAIKNKSDKNFTELYFEWWLDELKKVGLVKEYQREPTTFELRQPKQIFFKQYFKKKEPIYRSFNLDASVTYTPDYRVVFSSKMIYKLLGVINSDDVLLDDGDNTDGNIYQETLFYLQEQFVDYPEETCVVYFDVKPPSKALRFSGALGSSRDFPKNKILLRETHGIIVNKVVPIGQADSLFKKTFMPVRYRYTDSGSMVRKVTGTFNTLEQFLTLKSIKHEIKQ